MVPPMQTMGGDGTPADVAFVKHRLGGEEVLGVWHQDVEAAGKAQCNMAWILSLAAPCIAPVCYFAVKSEKKRAKHTLYFTTTHGFGTAVQHYEKGCCGCHFGKDYEYGTW